MNCAVVYYSKSGTTKKIAEKIQKKKEADLFLVEPEEAYGNYLSAVVRVGKEKLTKKEVKLKTEISDFADYDVIFIGFPVWYGTLPRFLQEYINKCNFKDKRIIPFATAGANGKESSFDTLKALLPGSKIRDYFYTSKVKKADVDKWLDEMDI